MHHSRWQSVKDQRWNWDDNRSYNIIILNSNECKCKCNAIPNTKNWIFGSWTRRNITVCVCVICVFRRNYSSSNVCMCMCMWGGRETGEAGHGRVQTESNKRKNYDKLIQTDRPNDPNAFRTLLCIPFALVRCFDLKMDDRLILKTINLSEVCLCVCVREVHCNRNKNTRFIFKWTLKRQAQLHCSTRFSHWTTSTY